MIEHGLLEITDFCCIGHAKIDFAKAGLTLILGDNQDTNAAINNGAGKTTVPKALTWCLYEDTLDGDRHDEVIRWGQSRTTVRHMIKIEKEVWRITRSRTKGKPRLELAVARNFRKGFESEFQLIQGDRKELQVRINELIGKDFRSFCNTTLYGEGDIERFFSATDSVKKDSIHRLLKSDVFKRAMTYIKKNHYDGLKKKVEELEHALDILSGRLEGYNIEQIKIAYDEWETERDSRVVRCSDECQDYLEDIGRVKREESQVQKKQRDELQEIKRKLRLASVQKKRYSKAPTDLALLKTEREALIGRRITLEEQAKNKKESLLLLQGDECPTCTSDLSEGKAGEHKDSLAELLSQIDKDKSGVAAHLKKVCGELTEKENEVEMFESAVDELNELGSNKDVLEGLIETSKSRVGSYIAERKSLASKALANAKRIEEEKNPHGDLMRTTKNKVGEIKAQIAEKKSELETVRSDFAHYGFWIKGFGPGGLPSLLLDSKMDFLSERANHYLLTLADGDITVFYRTQRELKQKGQMRDEIVAEVVIEGVPDVKPSKAQKRKLDIASDLGLMDMAVSRSGHSNLLIMDEVLDGMDPEGVRRVLELIHELRFAYPSIFVTTHEAGLLEIFERAICARKKDGAATVVAMKG